MRRRRLKILELLSAVLLSAWMVTSCVGNHVYDQYQQVPSGEWDREEVISFSIPPVSSDGLYDLMLGLRTTRDYPFMSLTLTVEAEVVGKKKTNYRLSCPLVNQRGQAQGQGLSLYQYDFSVAQIRLQAGDSVHINMHHDMKRESLPGISDLGISLLRKSL